MEAKNRKRNLCARIIAIFALAMLVVPAFSSTVGAQEGIVGLEHVHTVDPDAVVVSGDDGVSYIVWSLSLIHI